MTKLSSVNDVLALFEKYGEEFYGEDVTQNAHALQTAAFAELDDATDALIAASLLHDIGHLVYLADQGHEADAKKLDDLHEASGARALAGIFGPDVTGPIALHVTAKRYLCAMDPGYLESLAPASVISLAIQGGPLDAAGCEAFSLHPAAEDAFRLRTYDDQGKIEDLEVPKFEHYRALLQGLAK